METNQKLLTLYRLAVAAQLVTTKTDFANLLETKIATLSNCLNGVAKYSGTCENLVAKAENELSKRGINIVYNDSTSSGDGSGNVNINNEGVIARMLDEMAAQRMDYQKTIDRLLSIIESRN